MRRPGLVTWRLLLPPGGELLPGREVMKDKNVKLFLLLKSQLLVLHKIEARLSYFKMGAETLTDPNPRG